MVRVQQLLQDPGLFARDGSQLRPISRSDIDTALIALGGLIQNGMQPAVLQFDGLSLYGADLRGLNPSGGGPFQVSFIRCDMRDVLAGPSVKSGGRELEPHDLAYRYAVMLWATGQLESLNELGVQVSPTQLNEVWFVDSQLDRSDFSNARLRNAKFSRAVIDSAVFNGCKLRGAELSFAKLTNTDLSGSELANANLLGTELLNCKLDGVRWGKKQIVVQEQYKNWPQAHLVYRVLTAVHETAGLDDVAREFRYLRERALTHAIFATVFAPAISPTGPIVRRWSVVTQRERRQCFVRWLFRRFMDWLFGFGERPFRVVRAIGIVVLGFAPIYLVPSGFDLSLSGVGEFSIRLAEALYFSVASTSALGYGSWVDPNNALGWRVYLGGVQSFLGIFLNALFLVTFVRRWIR